MLFQGATVCQQSDFQATHYEATFGVVPRFHATWRHSGTIAALIPLPFEAPTNCLVLPACALDAKKQFASGPAPRIA